MLLNRPQNARIFLSGILLILIGCTQASEGQGTATPFSQQSSTRPSKATAPPTNVAENFPPSQLPTLVPGSTPLPDPTRIETITDCGVLLPILNDQNPPRFDTLSVTGIPPDFIPESARPALERMLEAPGTVGLAAYQIGQESSGVYLNAELPMPLASVAKIINLIAYAKAVEAGELDPASWIPLDEIEQFYLPGTDLRAHRNALAELEARRLIAQNPPSTPLEEVPWMMIRHSSNAASDYLQAQLGQEAIESTAVELGIESQTATCPFIGQFLIMTNHERQDSDRRAIEYFMQNPETYGYEVMRLANAYANDPSFRQREMSWRRPRPVLNDQIFFSENLNAQASAQDYSRLMAQIMGNEIGSSYVNILVRRVMEWPMIFPSNQELFSTIGYKNGSLPGILNSVYYGQRLEDGAQVVVVLFYRQLPTVTYRSWRQSLAHDELARWLLSEPEAIPALRQLLSQE
jgi:beta-lactamase class A